MPWVKVPKKRSKGLKLFAESLKIGHVWTSSWAEESSYSSCFSEISETFCSFSSSWLSSFLLFWLYLKWESIKSLLGEVLLKGLLGLLSSGDFSPLHFLTSNYSGCKFYILFALIRYNTSVRPVSKLASEVFSILSISFN